MTTLALAADRPRTHARQVPAGVPLRTWLAGRWAILFSHPDDFAQEQWESDRWVRVLSRSFGAWGIAAVALRAPGRDPAAGWLGRLAGPGLAPAATLAVESGDPVPPSAPAEFAAWSLRADIARHGPRFAMIIDSDLRCRRALRYGPPAGLPSPLELIGWAVALRKRAGVRECIPSPASAAGAACAGRRVLTCLGRS